MAASGPIHGRSSLSQRTTSPAKDIPESHSQAMPSADLLNRLSPDDIVVVKDEPSDVYPVELHVHESLDSSFVGRRKRSAAETVSREHWSHDPSSGSPKHRRISSTAESPSNQSLMSVIGGFKDKQESELKGDNSVLSAVSDADLHGSAALASRSTVDPQADLSADFMDTTLNNSQSTQDISWMNQSGMSGEQSGFGETNEDGPANFSAHVSLPLGFCPSSDKERRLLLMYRMNSVQAPKQSVQNMVTAVLTLENWLVKTAHESRPVNDIPPEQLDAYLTDFFSTVTKESGMDYSRETFCSLRCHLERYLKETDYGHSVMKSAVFVHSQEAYKQRLRSLKQGRMTAKMKHS
ncbi:uncharacterized protein LOC135464005 isoform X2 [Liolophura sinensis]|uniref:uncharacterized protein LOC135464005 isoform X2 n=1 Tax=Liolophura sinensis TaxID=3198878 RepID=UPI0031586883